MSDIKDNKYLQVSEKHFVDDVKFIENSRHSNTQILWEKNKNMKKWE